MINILLSFLELAFKRKKEVVLNRNPTLVPFTNI